MLKKIENSKAIIVENSTYDTSIYYSIEDFHNLGLDKVFNLSRLNKFVNRYIFFGNKKVYKKEDIEKLLECRKKLTPISELCSIYGFSYQVMYDWIRLHKFRYIITINHPYAGNAFIYSEDLEKIKTERDDCKKKLILNGEEYISIKEASKIAGFKIPKSRRKGFMSYTVIGGTGYMSRKEAEQTKPYEINRKAYDNKDSYKNRVEILNGKEYITIANAEEMIGLRITDDKRKKLKSYIVYKNCGFVQKNEIDNITKLKNDTVIKADFKLSLGPNCESRIINAIIRLNIEVIKGVENFYGFDLLYKKDLQKIIDHVQYRLDFEHANSKSRGIDIYKVHTRDIPIKNGIAITIALYSEYVIDRFYNNFKSKGQQRHMARVFANTHQMLIDTFSMEVECYKEETVDKMVQLVCTNKNYTKASREEFVGFMNHLIKVLKLNWKPYAIGEIDDANEKQKHAQKNKKEKIIAYSQKQFLSLWEFLHFGVKNSEYLKKTIADRLAAQKWLYMYLHFSTLWRADDIINIPSPNLCLLDSYGISDGVSFFNWLSDEKNVFTEEMGMIITESVKGQIKAFKIKISKTNENLFIEVGRLMSPVLGLLLAICEAHRQIAEKSGNRNYKTDTMLTISVSSDRRRDTFLDGKVKNILGGIFNNIRANKAYNNYIHNYSEETQSSFAAHIISILRGYRDERSETSAFYETRRADGTIDNKVAALIDRGSFAFAKFNFLSLTDKTIMELDETEQSDLIKSLEITPFQAEMAVKNVFEQSAKVIDLFSKMMIKPVLAHKILEQLAFGNSHSKHNHARCLLKAMLKANDSIADMDNIEIGDALLEQLKSSRFSTNCLFPDTDYCFGCPMLIGEMYFLYEINDVLLDTIKKLEVCDNEYERCMYSNLILKDYIPILREAQVVLGIKCVNVFVDIGSIRDKLRSLHKENKITLEIQGGKG